MAHRLGDAQHARWLEPCFGGGVFLEAMNALGVARKRVTAIDIDRGRADLRSEAHTIRGSDFLRWSSSIDVRFDRIIGNPPYVRICSLPDDLQAPALAILQKWSHRIDRTANYWLAFLVGALELLAPNGSLSFVLPAAWEYSNYARFIRREIGEHFSHVEVHRSQSPLFSGKQEGSVVLVCEGFGKGSCHPIRYEYPNLDSLCSALACSRGLTCHEFATPTQRKPKRSLRKTVRAGDVLAVRIGAVTGDSRFFLLTENQRQQLHLPIGSLVPVVSRASHIRHHDISRQAWKRLRDADRRVWLFRPPLDLVNDSTVKAYLANGGCDRGRYKIRHRAVWYQTELPPAIEGFMTGMSQISPWICLNRMRGLTATNTLYVVAFREQLTIAEKAAWCLSLLHPIARDAARSASRVYGDGLRKLEPSDIADLPLVVPKTTLDALEVYREALAHLFSGNLEASERIAEHWFRSQTREDRRGSTQGQ